MTALPLTRRPALLATGLVLLTVLAYIPAMGAGYIWDDDSYLLSNPLLGSVTGLVEFWIPGRTPQYYPLVFSSFWLEHQLWGLHPAGYHVTNILLHALGAALVWRLLRSLEVPAAWLVAAAFALHPVHVESVAWITERKNVLSGCLYLGAALAFVRHAGLGREPLPARPGRWYVTSLGLFVAALLSKSVTCSLPAALLLVLAWRRQPLTRARLRALAPMFAVGLALALHTAYLERTHVGAHGEAFDFSVGERLIIASRALLFYPAKLVVPWPLSFVYPRWEIDAASPLAYLPVLLVLALAAALVWLYRRGNRGAPLAVAFYAGTIFPALGFFNLYPMRYSFVADHFQYLASLGVLVLLAPALLAGARRLAGAAAGSPAAGCWLVVLALLTLRQQNAYQDLPTLWQSVLVHNPRSWLAHNNLGYLRQEAGDAEAALRHYQTAIEVQPEYPEAYFNVGRLRADAGQYADAIAAFEEALRRRPEDAATHKELGFALHRLGRVEEAVTHYRRSLAARPAVFSVQYNLARALTMLGRHGEALPHYQEAVRLRPQLAEARAALERARMQAPH